MNEYSDCWSVPQILQENARQMEGFNPLEFDWRQIGMTEKQLARILEWVEVKRSELRKKS